MSTHAASPYVEQLWQLASRTKGWSLKEAPTKTEGGESFPAKAYAYVPDESAPSTWKLRLWATPDGGPDARIVGMAVAALTHGFRGNKVQIPADARAGVLAKVRSAWHATHGKDEPLPEGIGSG